MGYETRNQCQRKAQTFLESICFKVSAQNATYIVVCANTLGNIHVRLGMVVAIFAISLTIPIHVTFI